MLYADDYQLIFFELERHFIQSVKVVHGNPRFSVYLKSVIASYIILKNILGPKFSNSRLNDYVLVYV